MEDGSSTRHPRPQLTDIQEVTIKHEPITDDTTILPAEPECLLKLDTEEFDADDIEITKNEPNTTPPSISNSTNTPSGPCIESHCQHCDAKFNSDSDVLKHFQQKHSSIRCVDCDLKFSSVEQFQQHSTEVHKKKYWNPTKQPCPHCKKELPYEYLEAHIQKHSMKFPCNICDKNFAYKNSLDRHIEKKHKGLDSEVETEKKKTSESNASKVDRTCICELCGKLYKGPKGLSYHMLLHTGEHPHVCQQCGQAFIYKNSLTSHMIREHGVTSPFICSICGKVFLSKTALDDHERKHTGERPYSCDICGRSFSSKAHLSTHKYDHIETKMKCTLCDESFTKRNDYYRHRARFHLPPRKKKHQCSLCGVAVTSRKALQDHLRVHTKEKPFECDMCGKRFGQKDLVTMHIKSHFKIRPNKCNTCGKCFPNKQALVVHERIHTGERPHVCRVCYQSFNQINSLKRHLKLHNAKYHLCSFCGRDFDVKSDLRIHHRNDHGLMQ